MVRSLEFLVSILYSKLALGGIRIYNFSYDMNFSESESFIVTVNTVSNITMKIRLAATHSSSKTQQEINKITKKLIRKIV